MTDKVHKTIWVKWVRSGIGFSHRQKTVLRSLGLRCPNHVVERPDTPQVRGLVARIHHLVEIVPAQAKPVAASVPEYTIVPPPQAVAVQDAPAKSGDGEVADTVAAFRSAPAPAPKKPEEPSAPQAAKRAAPAGKTKKNTPPGAPRKDSSESKSKHQKSEKAERSQKSPKAKSAKPRGK